MKLSKNSMHYKFNENARASWLAFCTPRTWDFCDYARGTLWNILLMGLYVFLGTSISLGYLEALTSVFSVSYFGTNTGASLFHLYVGASAVIVTLFSIFAVLAAGVVGILWAVVNLVGWVLDTDVPFTMIENTKEYLEARKEKYCPRVTWDEDDN